MGSLVATMSSYSLYLLLVMNCVSRRELDGTMVFPNRGNLLRSRAWLPKQCCQLHLAWVISAARTLKPKSALITFDAIYVHGQGQASAIIH
jgi:hypothetical protein